MTEHATGVGIRMRGAVLERRAVVGVGILALWVGSGCDGDGRVRAELAAQQVSWGRQLGTLRSEHALLKQRFVRDVDKTGSPPVTDLPQRARVRAAIDGVAQSLSDVESQARQAGETVTSALAQGTRQAQHALDNERRAMSTSVEALSRDVASAVSALEQLAQKDGSAAVASELGERR